MLVYLAALFLVQTSPDTITRVQLFNNLNTPVPMLEEVIDVKSGDRFDVGKLNRLRLRFMETGYYDHVDLLFYRNPEGVNVQYYFKERESWYSFSLYPIVTVKNHVGAGTTLRYDKLFATEMNVGISMEYAKSERSLTFFVEDLMWHQRMSYKFYADYFLRNYQYYDLPESERYLQDGVKTGMELSYRLDWDNRWIMGLELFSNKLSEGLYSDGLQNEITKGLLEFRSYRVDWPQYPMEGMEFNARAGIMRIKGGDTFPYVQGRYIFWFKVIENNLHQALGLHLAHTFEPLPHYLRFHLDGRRHENFLHSRKFIADSYMIVTTKSKILGTIEYDPFHTNSFMTGVDLHIAAGPELEDAKNGAYWQYGVTFNFFYQKNRIEFLVARDKFETLFFQLRSTL